MGEIIVIASGKGGVGKTAVTAGLGIALDSYDKRVLLIDADFGLRNLDIALGVESDVVYDILDCVDGRCTFETAAINIKEKNDIFFLPAPQSRSGKYIDEAAFVEFCESLRDKFDYIILDAPAGLNLELIAKCADRAIIVVQPFIASLRDADRCVDILGRNGVDDVKLVINCVRRELIADGRMWNVDNIIDLLGIPLLGIIPYDEEVLKGIAAADRKSIVFKALNNCSGRILGENIPVINPSKKQKRFGNGFKRIFKK